MSTLKKIRKIGLWILGIVVALLIASAVVSYIYKDKIIAFVTQELGSQINGKVEVGKINISFFSSFPKVSIQIFDVLAHSTPGFNKNDFPGVETDTAIAAGKISFAFDIIDFFNERYIVQEIKIKDAKIHLFLDSKGNHNMNFIKESKDTAKTNYFVELSKISFYNTETQVRSSAQKLYANDYFDYAFFSGKFLEKQFSLFVDTEVTSNILQINNDSYFKNIDLDIEFSIAQTDKLLQILSASIETPFAEISTKGNLRLNKNDTEIDLSYDFKIPDIEDLAPFLPNSTQSLFNDNKLRGDLAAKGTLRGQMSINRMPELYAEINYNNGSIYYDSDDYSFTTHGYLTTKDIGKLQYYSFSNATFNATRNETNLKGEISLTNFEDMTINLSSTINGKLEDLSEFVQPDEYTVKGDVAGTITYKGKLSDFDSFTPDFFNRTHSELKLSLKNVSIAAPSYSPYEFSDVSGKVTIINQNMVFDSIQGNIQGNKFTMQGDAPNMLNYIMFYNQATSFNGKLFVSKINLDPFETHYDKYLSTDTSSSTITARIDFSSNEVKYDTYTMQNVSCIILYSDPEVEFLQTKLKMLQGSYNGNIKVSYYSNNTSKLEANGEFKKMSAKELFKTFNNFDQTFLTESQINGVISTKFNFSSILDKDYNPVYPSMKILTNVIIEDGYIKDFEPFIDMGKKMKVEEFNNVTFSKIENTLKIENDTLYIPNMDIKTNAFEMNFSGKHAINNNEFKYFITLFMKKTLSNIFIKQNPSEDFGEIEQNTDGNIRVPIKIYGNPDKYIVDYDMKSSVKNVKQGLERQKDEWKTILNKNQPDEDNSANPQNPDKPKEKPKEKPIESDFQIEYDL